MDERKLIEEINFGVNLVIREVEGYSCLKPPEATMASKVGTSGDIALLKLSVLANKGIPLTRLAVASSHRRKTSVAVVKAEYSAWLGGRKHPCLLVLSTDSNTVKERRSESLRGFRITSFAEITLGLVKRP